MRRKFAVTVAVLAVVGGAVWFFWPARPKTPPAAPAPANTTAPLIAAAQRASASVRPSSAPASSANANAAARKAGLTPEQLHQFGVFATAMYFFNSRQAAEAGLTEDDCVALQLALWEAKTKLDQVIIDRAEMSWNGPNQVSLSVRLDDATVANLRAQFSAAATEAIGADKWQSFQSNEGLMAELNGGMMDWGQYATTLSFELTPSDAPDHEPSVRIDVMSDKNMQVMHSHTFPKSVFNTVYGPIAGRFRW